MSGHRNVALYFLSLLITLLLFGFCAMLFVVGTQGTHSNQKLLAVTKPDPLHTQVEVLGSSVQLDYTPLAEPERIRREYAPLLTPRLLLTAEYAAGYAAYWGEVLGDTLREYWFAQEAYGPDVKRVDAQQNSAAAY